MKAAEKDKPIHTIPEGAWEAGIINERTNRMIKNCYMNSKWIMKLQQTPCSQHSVCYP